MNIALIPGVNRVVLSKSISKNHFQQLHMLALWIGCRFWNGLRLLIPWDKTVINNSCKQNFGRSRRKERKSR